MTIYFPEAVTVQESTKVALCTTIADLTAPSIASEIKAVTTVEATMAFRDWAPTLTPNTGNSPARLGTAIQLPVEGNIPLSAIATAYPWDPSADDADVNNEVKALMIRNTLLYVVVRKGIDITTDWAAGQPVDVWHVRCGFQDDDATSSGAGSGGGSTDEFAEFEVHQNLFPLSLKTRGTLAA